MTPFPHTPQVPTGIGAAADSLQPLPSLGVRVEPVRSLNEFQRIDQPHADAVGIVGKPSASRPGSWNSAPKAQPRVRPEPVSETNHVGSTETLPVDTEPENWLQLHAADLIDRLSQWSADLDAREAELNARIAKQDLRERQFRLHQQLAETEMAEQQRAIDRLRRQIQDHASRLAFRGA